MKPSRFAILLFFFMAASVLRAGPAGEGGETVRQPGPYNFDGLCFQIDGYLERFHDPAFSYDPRDLKGRFSYQEGGSYDLYGSCDMVYLLWTTGELSERTTKSGREQWARIIRDYQDPETGWWTHGNETLHFKEHATAYATGALQLLGYEPLHPFRWKEEMTGSPEALDKWLSGIWWDVVWVGSHQGGGVAASLAMTGEASDQWFEWYLDWLDNEVNPRTGLWQRAFYNSFYKKPMKNDLGGAAHFWWVYQERGRPIPCPEKVIDTVLGLQRDNGLWEKYKIKETYPTCINCDAINGINAAHARLLEAGREYRTGDIVRSYDRFMRSCQDILNSPDSLERLYKNSHDLPGAFIGIAEADRFMRYYFGKSSLDTRHEWRSVLTEICWL